MLAESMAKNSEIIVRLGVGRLRRHDGGESGDGLLRAIELRQDHAEIEPSGDVVGRDAKDPFELRTSGRPISAERQGLRPIESPAELAFDRRRARLDGSPPGLRRFAVAAETSQQFGHAHPEVGAVRLPADCLSIASDGGFLFVLAFEDDPEIPTKVGFRAFNADRRAEELGGGVGSTGVGVEKSEEMKPVGFARGGVESL